MLKAIVAALGTSAVGSPGAISGAWGNISFSTTNTGNGTTSSTVTFTGGGSRLIKVTHDISVGALSVTTDGTTYTALSSGATFSVTTGQTVKFKYNCGWSDESATVTVIDDSLSSTIDTFTCACTFTGVIP